MVHHGFDGYARKRIEDLNESVDKQRLQSNQNRRRRALSDLELEERVIVLEKMVVGLLEYLEATQVVDADRLSGVLEAIEIYDVNGDGEIDADDLKDKYGVAVDAIEERKAALEQLVKVGKRRIHRARRRR